MTEWRLFRGNVAHVSTAEFHKDRPRAPHLEQPMHRDRLFRAASFVQNATRLLREKPATVSDLGCGDGGLLSLVQGTVHEAWGYDFSPANTAGWVERGVSAEQLDVFGADSGKVRFGTVTVVTEVLEHLTDPHNAVKWIGANSAAIVASSPWDESPDGHDECHAWSWDLQGYRNLIGEGGYRILRHELVGRFQVVLGMRI